MLLASGLALLACGPGSGIRGQQAEDGSLRVAVAPLNLVSDLDAVLDGAETRVGDALVGYLRERGARIGLVHRGDAERVWGVALSGLEGVADPEARLISSTATVWAR